MTLLDSSRTSVRRYGVVALAAFGLIMFAACGGSGDDNDDSEQPTEVVATVAPSGPTSTPEPPPDPSATPTEEPTSTPEATATATPSPTPVPPTPTATITPTPSPTPLPTRDDPFGEVIAVADLLPNYTLDYTVQFDGIDDSSVELFIAQARPDLYHLRVVSAGQQTEAWRVDEVIYVLGPGGAVVELPGLVDPNLYAPSSFLFLVPDLSQIGVATILDEDADVDGRPATLYEVDPASASAFLPPQSDATGQVDGVFQVWVDDQLNVITRMQADIEWVSGSTRQVMQMEYLISQIDGTPDVAPPGQ